MDKITFIGNLGNDPEMRYTPSGQAVTTFPVAVTRRWTGSDGEKKEQTLWLRVSVWGKQAESANQYLSKGKKIYGEGELTPDEKTGGPRVYQRKDGEFGASFEVRATRIEFLSPKSAGGGYDEGEPAEE